MSAREQLAPGAPAAAGTIPLSVPHLAGNEWKYVRECLDTNWVSSVGAYVDRLERVAAEYVGAQHAVATVNGTSALHVALLLAGVQRDDEVLLPALSFIAPAFAVRYAGAWPVVIDVEPDYWQLDPNRVADFLARDCRRDGDVTINVRTGRPVRAILPVHVLGHPCDMDPLLELARSHGLALVEDAAESIGAVYRGRKVGAMGDVGCLSFNGNKVITCGGGGMVVTNDVDLAARARYLTTQAKDDPLEYVHGEVGYNYRLTNVLAAIGCAQMETLDEYLAVKRRIAATYTDALAELPGITPMTEAPWARSIWWLYTVLVGENAAGISSRDLLRKLAEAGIQSRPVWQPLHRSAALNGAFATPCPVADRIHRDALSLPCSVGLSEKDQQRVISEVRQHVGRAAVAAAR